MVTLKRLNIALYVLYIASPDTHLICLIPRSVFRCGVRLEVRASPQCWVYSTLLSIAESTSPALTDTIFVLLRLCEWK